MWNRPSQEQQGQSTAGGAGYDSATGYHESEHDYGELVREYLPDVRNLLIGLSCFALGMAVMYLLDPVGGGRRRALIRDKAVSTTRRTGRAVRGAAQTTADHLKGMAAEARSALRHEEVPDDVLVERVRAAIGRATSHVSSIEVAAREGVITLRGPILADEVDHLVKAVRHVRGVCDVDNQLSVHETAGNIPGLQGG